MVDGSWGAEVERNGVGVGVRYVSLWRAIWHVLTVRRPDEYAPLKVSNEDIGTTIFGGLTPHDFDEGDDGH
jgi:hypothetical protein